MTYIETNNYYILIKTNNDIDLDISNNQVQVIGIFSSKKNAEEKRLSYLDCTQTHNYIIQGPFSIDKNGLDIVNPIPRYSSIHRPGPTPRSSPTLHPDIYNRDIFPDQESYIWFKQRQME